VEFPADAGAVLDLVAGRLNVLRCHVCGLETRVDLTMIAFRPEAGAVATVGFEADGLEDLRSASAELGVDVKVFPQADLEALQVTVAGWLEAYLAAALEPVLSGESKPARNEEGVMPHQEPLVLRWLWRAATDGFPVQLRTDPPLAPEQQAELSRELLTDFTVGLVDGLFTHAFHHGGIATVLDLVEERVPVECLDEQVLRTLIARCIDFEPELLEDPPRFDRAFRFEYLCAVAHAAAGRSDPRAANWAELALLLHVWSRSEAVQVPEEMLLKATVLRRLIAFEDAWNVASPLFANADGKSLAEAEAWFDHIGWGERFRQEWAAVPLELAPEDLADLDEEELAARLREVAAEKGEDFADQLPRVVATLLLRAGRRDDAIEALHVGLDVLAEQEEWARVGWMAIAGAELMNRHLDYEATMQILGRHLDSLLEEDVGCQLRYAVVNEMGNAFRHQGVASVALETYDLVEKLMEGCEGASQHDHWVRRRNRAIVLRELGHFDEAIAEFESLLEESDPEDRGDERVGLLVSLARTYVDASLPERALPYAEEAAKVSLASNRAPQRIEVLLSLAAARAASRPGSEIPELTEALRLAERLPRLQTVVAAATLHHARGSVLDGQTIARAHAIVEDRWRSLDAAYPPSVLVTAGFCLAEWELGRGDDERAREIVADLRRTFGDRLPWMVSYLEARLPGTSVGEAWRLIRSVLDALDGSVPDQAGVGFAAPYLVDKADVQQYLLLTLRSALAAGLAQPADCIPVFEFLNGREMGGTGGAARPDPLERLQSAAAGLPALFLLLLEHEGEVQVVWVRPNGGCGLVPFGVDAPTLRRISVEFAARVETCLTDSQMRGIETLLEPVLAALGAVIDAQAAPGEHVCILPSPALLGLPVHAARGVDGTLLLNRHSFSVAPNLSVVCRALEGREGEGVEGPCLIAAVCKQGDREEFVAGAEAAAERVEGILGEVPVSAVRGAEADKAAVLSGLERCDHFVFIGHGARAPRAHGRGLCVAADGMLPGSPLPVDTVPELRRFVIDAGDLEGLASTPAVVSSIACSSGRSFAGEGGTRLGLERALFAGGTRTILAPQWDVNGPTALRFLELFYETLCDDSAVGVAEAHRRTCLALEEECGHLFLWGPFVLNGSWR
jgi:tetratricopeptide (TPR) repeat protein